MQLVGKEYRPKYTMEEILSDHSVVSSSAREAFAGMSTIAGLYARRVVKTHIRDAEPA